jgi:hypothetical protein
MTRRKSQGTHENATQDGRDRLIAPLPDAVETIFAECEGFRWSIVQTGPFAFEVNRTVIGDSLFWRQYARSAALGAFSSFEDAKDAADIDFFHVIISGDAEDMELAALQDLL